MTSIINSRMIIRARTIEQVKSCSMKYFIVHDFLFCRNVLIKDDIAEESYHVKYFDKIKFMKGVNYGDKAVFRESASDTDKLYQTG